MSAMMPPAQWVRHFGHHWLAHASGELMVLQWNPGSKTWTHSNAHDTALGKPVQVHGWRWIEHVALPSHRSLDARHALALSKGSDV